MSRSDKPIRQQEELPRRRPGRQAQAQRMAVFAMEVAQLALAHSERNGLTELEAAAVYAQQTHALVQTQAERTA